MSKAHAVAQHLPYLRRYARALTGSQTSGDACVAATLEVLVKEPELLTSADSQRVTLFRLFSTIWNSLAVNGASDPVGTAFAAERNLNQMTAKPRQAFLLVSVEGFSEVEAARILDVDASTLLKLVEEAGRELAAQLATDVLIIEDETLIALDLEALVENLGHRVIGAARTRTEAATIARTKPPGLILADIQLADGSSGSVRGRRRGATKNSAGQLDRIRLRSPGLAFASCPAAGFSLAATMPVLRIIYQRPGRFPKVVRSAFARQSAPAD